MKFRNTLTIATIATIGSLSIYSPSYAATPTRLVQLAPTQRVASATKPQSAEDYVERGKAKLDAKDYQGAIIEYTRAIQLNPESFDAYLGRSNAKYQLVMKKDPGGTGIDLESMNDAAKSMQLKDNSMRYLNNGGKKSEDKDYLGAISDFDRVIKIGVVKHTDIAYVARGEMKYKLGRKQAAIRDIESGAES